MSEKLVWLILVQLAFLKGGLGQNSTQNISLPLNGSTKVPTGSNLTVETTNVVIKVIPLEANKTQIQNVIPKNSSESTINATNITNAEVAHIFHEASNITVSNDTTIDVNNTLINCWNSTSCIEQTFNDTYRTNYSIVAEAIACSTDVSAFRLQSSAAIAAGVCLVSGVIGYFSCVGYRRYLQKKYGDSQMLKPDDFYDTSDLRYFEI